MNVSWGLSFCTYHVCTRYRSWALQRRERRSGVSRASRRSFAPSYCSPDLGRRVWSCFGFCLKLFLGFFFVCWSWLFCSHKVRRVRRCREGQEVGGCGGYRVSLRRFCLFISCTSGKQGLLYYMVAASITCTGINSK